MTQGHEKTGEYASHETQPSGARKGLWVDDVRLPPAGWDWAKTYDEAVSLLSQNTYESCSLDHDLGDFRAGDSQDKTSRPRQKLTQTEKTGYDVALWMAEHDTWPRFVSVHSMNPVGRQRIQATIDRYHPTGGRG